MTSDVKRSSRAGFWIAIVLLLLLLIFSITVNIFLAAGLALISGDVDGEVRARDEFPHLQEKWSYGEGSIKAARIPVTGIMTRHRARSLFDSAEYDFVETVKRQIRAAINDDSVKAIILEIDSPGGEITAADEIHNALLDFKMSAGDRVVIAFIRAMAASGGYYVATAADRIIAEPTAIVGSISAIMQTLNWKGLSDNLGIHDVTIKTGAHKDLLNPFSDVNTDQLAIIQELLDSMHRHFVQVVRAGRDIDSELLENLADGRIFSVKQALEYNLVDQTGYWKDVMDEVSELLGYDSVRIIRYEERSGFLRMFSQVRMPLSGPSSLLERHRPRFMYLWSP